MSASHKPIDAAAMEALLAQLWQANLPLVRERLQVLDATLREPMTPAARAEGNATAHKLAGALGMFGYHQGTELARQLETALGGTDPVDLDTLHMLADRLWQSLALERDADS